MLRFIASGTRYATYQDRDGNVVFLLNGSMRRAIETAELPKLWEAFVDAGQVGENGYTIGAEEWLEQIGPMLLDDSVWYRENVWECTECDVLIVGHDDHRTVTRDNDDVCLACFQQSFTECADCDTAHYSSDLQTTLHNEEICERCREYNYYYCDSCEGWYYQDSSDHEHSDECDCESPDQVFGVPHHGGRLSNDEEVVVTLPGGTITDEGLRAVEQIIRQSAYEITDADERMRQYALCSLPHEVGNEWQTRAGNFTKRLSKLAYKNHGIKIDPDMLGKIGTVAREHTSDVTDLTIAVTRDLNQSAEDFGHEGSCWWESYSSSRCALKSNGGFGLRSFYPGYSAVRGRVWVMPLKVEDGDLVPTFQSMAEAYIVFNGYGELSGYTGARVMAHMAGLTYRKVGFDSSPMYVNSGGYLVATEEIVQEHGTKHLRFNLNEHSSLYQREQDEASLDQIIDTQEAAHVA